MIPIFQPYLKGNEDKYINTCIKTNWISSQGSYVKKFEYKFSRFHNMKYCLTTSSCTTAIHLSLLAFGISNGDEVLCPSLTFIAPANMIRMTGATPVFVDVDFSTLTIDYRKIENKITNKTKAIMVVHQFGHSAHMNEINQIAKRYNLKVIEDCAESLGAKYKSKKTGTIGDVSCFSFFSNKIITTGEGGAILTNNKVFYNNAKIIRDHGMSLNKKYLFLKLGTNYRMTNLQAAIGLAQLEKINKILNIRKKQMNLYYEELKDINTISLRAFDNFTEPVHWLMTIKLLNSSRSKFINYMSKKGIECRPMIDPVITAFHFKKYQKKNEFNKIKKVTKSYVHLPSSTNLKEKEILYICKEIKKFFKN